MAMTETGDAFIRRTAQFIRANAPSLAAPPSLSTSSSSPFLGWVATKPTHRIFSIDATHLFFLLVQFDALSIHVGDLDRTVDTPARPSSRLHLPDTSETRSLADSVYSTVSSLTSSSFTWWNTPRNIEHELKFIYSSFTKLPAIHISPPSTPAIAEFSLDDHAIPLHVFKNLQRLQCTSLDPRMLVSWPPFLRSLSLNDSGRDDIIDLLPTECTLLRHLSLSNNGLTSISSIPLTSLVSLDLSSNLLVSVPSALSDLYNLASLSLADNMIDSVLGIYTHLGNIQTLNLASNRLESICGLERLTALERIDLRDNLISDSGEVSRLAVLPNISAVYVNSNPFCGAVESWRVVCFDYFWKEGKSVRLDGLMPTWAEKRGLSVRPDGQMSSSRSAPTVLGSGEDGAVLDKSPNPQLASVPRKKRKVKRIVDLDHHQITEEEEDEGGHGQETTDDSRVDEGEDDAKTPTVPHGHGHARHRTEIVSSSYRDTAQLPTFAPIMRPPARRQATTPLPESPSLPTHPSRSSNSSFNSPSRSSTTLSPPLSNTRPSAVRSSTMASRSAKRAVRVSASMFEPASSTGGAGGGSERLEADGEALRRKIEALKREMGDGWLGVYSQSQVT